MAKKPVFRAPKNHKIAARGRNFGNFKKQKIGSVLNQVKTHMYAKYEIDWTKNKNDLVFLVIF